MADHEYNPRVGDTWCRHCNSEPGEAPHDDMPKLTRDERRSRLEGWSVSTSRTGMVTRGDPRSLTISPFVARALAAQLPAKEYAR